MDTKSFSQWPRQSISYQDVTFSLLFQDIFSMLALVRDDTDYNIGASFEVKFQNYPSTFRIICNYKMDTYTLAIGI